MPREEKGSPQMGSYDDAPTGGSNAAGGGGGSSLAARRARLRGTLARASYPQEEEFPASTVAESMPEDTATAQAASTSSSTLPALDPGFDPVATASAPVNPQPVIEQSEKPLSAAVASALSVNTPAPLPIVSEQAMEVLTNIDSALNACATNLAALQRLAGEQTDVLKGLSTTLQNQTLFEIGLNLNSLTESLTAALEPMKAMGELVPAMDQLVSTLEGREAEANNERLSPDQLVTSLADQLSAALIDPWTFKCAYMAIYPTEHPADLLHRLVELLGTQRLSGDLFRAAYEAVQGAEPPSEARASRRRSIGEPSSESGMSAEAIAINEEIRGQIEDLQRANEDLLRRQEEREAELKTLLSQKEMELQEAQELLNSRYDEFNSRYEEVADALNKREEEYRALLESKDMELVEKESELNLLRAQMEELRNNTEDMVKDFQKQLTEVKTAAAQEPSRPSSFFDAPPQPEPQRPAFESQATQSTSGPIPVVQPPMPQPAQPPMQQQLPSQITTQQMSVAQLPSNAVPQPPAGNQPPPVPPQQTSPGAARPPAGNQQQAPTTPFTPNAGSYGSGVRAQVFEVIVRQALAGAPWREICAGPMQVNNISPDEVEAEVKRRQALLNK